MDNVEVVTIGDELLNGLVVNTNAAYLCRELQELGITVQAYHALPDTRVTLRRKLTRILQDSSLVIVTGGLGPTIDDNTREVMAEIFNSGFRFDDGIAASLRERYGDDLASLQNQATVPSKATVIPNEMGTAPGLLFEAKTVTVFLLPGIPLEMQALFQAGVKPYLEERLPYSALRQFEYVILTGTREQEVDPLLRKFGETTPELGIGIYPRPGALTISLSSPIDDACTLAAMTTCKEAIAAKFSEKAISAQTGRIEETIQALFIKNGLTLSLAESCTGGALASKLTSLPGASAYFLGSIVSYSDDIKKNLLGVHDETLVDYGAVSEETAIEMAKGALVATGSDYSIAVTGIAGPTGGSPQKPVGTVWLAMANRAGVIITQQLRGRGTRSNIIESSANAALCHLWLAVNRF